MTLISNPPEKTPIFQYPPNFPNGQVSEVWLAWFQEVQANNFVFPAPVTGFALGWDASGNLVNVANTGADQTAQWTAADAIVAGNAVAKVDLASTSDAAKGAGSVGFDYATGYGAGTIGKWLKDLATSVGATFLGYLAPFTGAVVKTLDLIIGDFPISPVMFGAVGNGTTDDSAALQAMFNAGKSIRFKSGATYIINEQIEIASKTNFAIYGNGATIKAKDGMTVGSGTRLLYLTDCTDFSFENLILDGNRTNRTPAETTSHLFNLQNCKRWKLDSVSANNGTTDGFYIGPGDKADRATYCEDWTMLNCFADNNYRQGASIINAENGQVVGGAYTNTNGISPSAGIDVEADVGTATPSNRGITFTNVECSGNDGFGLTTSSRGTPYGIVAQGCRFSNNDLGGASAGCDMTFLGCTFDTMSVSGAKALLVQTVATAYVDAIGCYFQDIVSPAAATVDDGGASGLLRVVNCRFLNCVANTPSSKNVVFANNLMTSCPGIGINSSGANARLHGNTILGAVGRGILSAGVGDIITDNIVKDVTSVSGGYIQTTGAGVIVRGNYCEATTPATSTPAMQIASTAYVVEENVAVGLHSTEPYVISGGFTGMVFRNNVGGTANDVRTSRTPVGLPKYSTASRPAANSSAIGGCYFDVTLNKPAWSDGTNWRDAAGTIV